MAFRFGMTYVLQDSLKMVSRQQQQLHLEAARYIFHLLVILFSHVSMELNNKPY